MIDSDSSSIMSQIARHSEPNHHRRPHEYSLLPPTRDEDLPGDLQSLSWLTAVDVPRLQQMANVRREPHPHPGALARAADLHMATPPGPVLHASSGMAPRGLLGLGPIGSHGASHLSQLPAGGQPAPSLQDTSPLYTPATQLPFPLPTGAQQ
ncbi:forkhead box protein N4, partial [Dipodomys spectabilis]|uniref:forkhead box protein N4 n=1 Tax=Dipodomys spectabilis TaxID=105255 RepID=UPI001C53E8A6